VGLVQAAFDPGDEEVERRLPEATSARRSMSIRNEVPPAPGTAPAALPAGGSLTRVTANFTPRGHAALEEITDRTGDSETDVLNTAVLLMNVVLKILERSDGVLHVVYPDGTEQHVCLVR
jgi:hypothetical protein